MTTSQEVGSDGAPRILFAGPEFPAARALLAEALPEAHIDHLESRTVVDRHHASVLVPLMARVDGEFLDSIEGLRLVQQWGAGLEGVDLAAATARGIAVGNVGTAESGNADAVAEWCVLAALALARRLRELERAIRAGDTWGAPIGATLLGKTAGIVGLGGIGRALAKRLTAFEMELIAVTEHPSARRTAEAGCTWCGGIDELDELLARADFVFLCLPLTTATRHLIDARALEVLRPGAALVNPGRGALVEEAAIVSALTNGTLAAFATDVYEREPVAPDHPLLELPNVLATPHIAGVADSSYTGIARHVAAIVRRLVAGEALDHCRNWNDVAAARWR